MCNGLWLEEENEMVIVPEPLFSKSAKTISEAVITKRFLFGWKARQ